MHVANDDHWQSPVSRLTLLRDRVYSPRAQWLRISTRSLNPSPGKTMWECKHCSEQLEDSFETCWSCGYSRDGSPPAVSEDEPVEEELPEKGDEITRAELR